MCDSRFERVDRHGDRFGPSSSTWRRHSLAGRAAGKASTVRLAGQWHESGPTGSIHWHAGSHESDSESGTPAPRPGRSPAGGPGPSPGPLQSSPGHRDAAQAADLPSQLGKLSPSPLAVSVEARVPLRDSDCGSSDRSD